MDEPLSNLDAKLRHEMRREIRTLQRRLGITMISVTPDQVEAMTMAHPIALLTPAASNSLPLRRSSTRARPPSSPPASSAPRR